MRTLHLLKTAEGAVWALLQMRELVSLGVEVHAVMPDGPLVDKYREAGIKVHSAEIALRMRRPHRWRGYFRAFRDLIDSIQPDIIHSHFVSTTLTMRLALGKNHQIPRVFQVPGPLHLEHPVFRRAEIATAGNADYWIGSCRWTCQRYRASGVPDNRVSLAYYGTDIETYSSRDPGKLRNALGVNPEVPLVGIVAYMYAPKKILGQLRGLKGHEDLIDAMKIVRKSRPSAQLVVVGGAWGGATSYEDQVRSYGLEQLGDAVHFLGTRKDVPELYADLDVVAHPSHSENVGGAAESLLLGVPTITTNVGGFPDLVKPAKTGWLVPPKSPPDLAAAILEALEDKQNANELAENGRQLAREVMDVRENARDVLTAYQSILAARESCRS